MTIIKKTQNEGFCPARTPKEIAMAEIQRTKDFCRGDFWWVLVELKTKRVFFLFLSCDSFNSYLMGHVSCFHNPFYLLFVTSYSVCWSVYLNCFISRQSLCILATTAARSCDHLFNDIIQPFWGLIWSYFMNLYFLNSCDMLSCRNNLCKAHNKEFSVWSGATL